MMPVRTKRANRCGQNVDPFTALSRWSREMDGFFGGPSAGNGKKFPVDIRVDGEDLVLEAELPGLTREKIDITVEDNVLTIASERPGEHTESQENYQVRERWQGSFSRSFRLPNTADSENIAAKLENGVLTLRVPTREEAKARKIEVG